MKGQLAMEFVIMMAVAFIIGGLFLAVLLIMFRDVSEEQRVAALNDVGFMIQDELILATLVEDGYQREFTIPTKADRFPYTISNTASGVTLKSSGVTITYPIPNITGGVTQGDRIVTKQDGKVTIT